MKPQIYVEGISSPDDDAQRRVNLVVLYEGKEGRIEIPAGAPQSDRQPGAQVFRTQLLELMAALEQWADSHEDISWQRHD